MVERKGQKWRDDWSKVVWDLLSIGMNKAFNRKRAGYVNAPRQARDPVHMDGMSFVNWQPGQMSRIATSTMGPNAARRMAESGGEEPPTNVREEYEGEDQGGVSLVLLETGVERERFEE